MTDSYAEAMKAATSYPDNFAVNQARAAMNFPAQTEGETITSALKRLAALRARLEAAKGTAQTCVGRLKSYAGQENANLGFGQDQAKAASASKGLVSDLHHNIAALESEVEQILTAIAQISAAHG